MPVKLLNDIVWRLMDQMLTVQWMPLKELSFYITFMFMLYRQATWDAFGSKDGREPCLKFHFAFSTTMDKCRIPYKFWRYKFCFSCFHFMVYKGLLGMKSFLLHLMETISTTAISFVLKYSAFSFGSGSLSPSIQVDILLSIAYLA